MLPPNGNENLCGHNFSPESCPYEGCSFRAALKKIADLEAQLKFADPCGMAKDVLNGTYHVFMKRKQRRIRKVRCGIPNCSWRYPVDMPLNAESVSTCYEAWRFHCYRDHNSAAAMFASDKVLLDAESACFFIDLVPGGTLTVNFAARDYPALEEEKVQEKKP